MLNLAEIQAFMVALITCKNEEDPIKNEGSVVLTTFVPLIYKAMGMFSDAQAQLTPQSVVKSDLNSNSSEIYNCPPYLQV